MKLSPLDLCRYFVTESTYSANPEFDPEKAIEVAIDQLSVETSITKIDVDVPGRVGWSVELNLSYQLSPKQNYPYNYSLHVVGLFSSPAEVPDGLDDERLVRVNGCSMLYGIAREIVRGQTAAGPWGEVLIPTVSFFESKQDEKGDEETSDGPEEV